MQINPRRPSWGIASAPRDFVVVFARDASPEERRVAVPTDTVARGFDTWLREPATRALAIRMHREVTQRDFTTDAEVSRDVRAALARGVIVALWRERRFGAAASGPRVGGYVPEFTPDERLTWIEIELYDTADRPVTGQRYRITLPDGSTREGRLDGRGFARIDGIDPGTCRVTFPDLHKGDWKKR